MFLIPGSQKKFRLSWGKIRKKAPKVPDITCPAIDDVLNQLEKLVGRELSDRKYKAFERKLERLRRANEQLRDSGKYWYDACKKEMQSFYESRKKRK